jgi:hypothetical protein
VPCRHRAAAAVVGCLLALLALLGGAAGVSAGAAAENAVPTSPFTHDGPTFVLTSPGWTIIIPIVEENNSGTTGLLIYNETVYTFPVPKNKVGKYTWSFLVRLGRLRPGLLADKHLLAVWGAASS